MLFYRHVQFHASLNALWKKGGQYQKAADKISMLIGRSTSAGGADAAGVFHGVPLTNHGESRIKHCLKYDLNGFCRLITVQTDGYCVFLYCGDHDSCDRWLDEHRGHHLLIDENKRIVDTYRSSDGSPEGAVGGPPGHHSAPLYERLPEGEYEALIKDVPRKVARQLEALRSFVTEGELWEVLAGVEGTEQRLAIHDVFALLRADRVVEALRRIKEYRGELTPLDHLPTAQLPEVVDSDVVRRIDPTSPLYGEALRRFMQSARYRDWMLFMHPDQEAIVEEDFAGAAKLVGVSGSGKTCVVVRRAVRLAERYRGERVLVLTLNRALANLIGELVDVCAPEELRSSIDVKPFFELCRDLILEFEPNGGKLYREVTWKSNEHVDEVWQEYYRCETNNDDASVLLPVHDSLLGRGYDPERYLREETDWIRSALWPAERTRYLDIQRTGRKVMLTRQFREMILEGVKGWEDKTSVVGVVDQLGLTQMLARYRPRIRARYRCVLVDEVQDFGNIELEVVRALAEPKPNDLLLCGDAAQAVTTKFQRLKDAGIDIPAARSRQLNQNYRNSSDVLGAAYEVLMNNLSDDLLDKEDLEVLDPKFSTFSGATPLLLEAGGLSPALTGALALAKEKLAGNAEAKICIAICGFSLHEMALYGEKLGLPVLDGTRSLDEGGIFLSDLPQTKGFEFDLVCILNCSEGVLPDRTAPDEEQYRDLATLYVAMTRAKTDLVLSWCGAPSPFLKGSESRFLPATWKYYVPDLDERPAIRPPRHLDVLRTGKHKISWREMNAEQFLYTKDAIGISPELSAKMRALVDGMAVRKGNQTIKWAKIGAAADSFRDDRRARALWGPEVGQQFATLLDRLRESRAGVAAPDGALSGLRARRPTTKGSQ